MGIPSCLICVSKPSLGSSARVQNIFIQSPSHAVRSRPKLALGVRCCRRCVHLDPVERLQRELARTREEKETLAAQYRTLLSKLTTMRTTLGNKLQKDAVRGAPVRSEASALTGQTGRARPARAADPAALGAE